MTVFSYIYFWLFLLLAFTILLLSAGVLSQELCLFLFRFNFSPEIALCSTEGSGLFIVVLFLVSSLVVAFRLEYMLLGPRVVTFMWLVTGFVVRMLLLVSRTRVWAIFIGWDGLGVISYFLVVYYRSASSRTAGKVTIIRNRVGDLFLITRLVSILIAGLIGGRSARAIYLEEGLIRCLLILTTFKNAPSYSMALTLPTFYQLSPRLSNPA